MHGTITSIEEEYRRLTACVFMNHLHDVIMGIYYKPISSSMEAAIPYTLLI